MPAAEARIRTHRASRYLTQLCEHTARIGDRPHRHGHTELLRPRRAEHSEADGVIDFDEGRCTLRATAEELVMVAEAADPRRLRLIQDALGARLEMIGRRDRLTLTWQPASAAAILEQLMTPAGRADPYPLYAAAHTLGPVSPLPGGSFLVSGYAAVDQVLRDPGFGLAESSGTLPSMSRSILRANPPDHGRMRSLIAKVFTPRRVAALRPAVEQAVAGLLDRLAETAADGAPVDFMDHVAFPLPVTVIGELLGVPPADRHRFRPLAADLTEALELAAASAATEAAAGELAEYFAHLIAERRTAPGDDLVSALVAVRDADDGRLSDAELLANLILLLVAGFETTTNLLGNGLAALLDHPELRTERLDITDFVEEVLRHDSPVQVVTRQAHADGRTVEGIPVPVGGDLILLIGAANRDPARYPDPDRFDPTRADIRPLSFGAGPHICIGNSLARLEAAIVFTELLARFPDLSAAHPRLRRDRLVLRGYETLPVRIAGAV